MQQDIAETALIAALQLLDLLAVLETAWFVGSVSGKRGLPEDSPWLPHYRWCCAGCYRDVLAKSCLLLKMNTYSLRITRGPADVQSFF